MTGWYVYGVADGDRTLESDDVRLVPGAGLAAIVAPVDLEEFGEEQLVERLNDRPWLEAKAVAHEQVLSRLLQHGPVVPLRFGTVYRRLDDVVELLGSRREELLRDLERVRGQVELGVKGWADRPRLEEALSRERVGAPAGSPGRAYLARKQVERDVAAEAASLLAEIARTAHSRLAGLAAGSVVNRPQPRELTGRREQMFLNSAYLVPRGDDALRRAVAALDEAHGTLGVSFEATGPWPPYNFVGREESTA